MLLEHVSKNNAIAQLAGIVSDMANGFHSSLSDSARFDGHARGEAICLKFSCVGYGRVPVYRLVIFVKTCMLI